MTIQVLLFGACREAVGCEQFSIELPPEADVASAFAGISDRYPVLDRFARSALFAVNEEHARGDQLLADGDTLAVFPPVSGGESVNPSDPPDMDVFEITREPIDKAGLELTLLAGEAGAIVTFDGVVRNNTKGRPVVELHYDAYVPMAIKEMRRIGGEIREKWPDIARIGMIHRFGRMQVSESSVVIVIASPHRRAAFEACRYAIDRLKQTVPIWKKEVFADGEVWVEGEKPQD